MINDSEPPQPLDNFVWLLVSACSAYSVMDNNCKINIYKFQECLVMLTCIP